MADNINVTAGTGTVVASDDIGGIQHQRVKVVIGADGISNGDVSASNPMPISAASMPLPSGAATETTLSALNTKVTAVNTGAVTISSALPAGANSIGQVTVNAGTNLNTSALNLETTQAAMSAKMPATIGQKAMAASLAVTIASDQTSIPVASTLAAETTKLIGSVAQVDGLKATYSTSVSNLAAVATAATDIFTITGSATKTIRVTRLTLTATQTTAAQVSVVLLKRSTANTAGTSTAQAAGPHDSNSAAATATVLAYTANPTTGTLVANLRSRKVFVGTTTGNSDEFITEFGVRNCQAIVLRGIVQVFAINLVGASVAGNSFNIGLEWTEE